MKKVLVLTYTQPGLAPYYTGINEHVYHIRESIYSVMPTKARAILCNKNYFSGSYDACVEVKASKSHHNVPLHIL